MDGGSYSLCVVGGRGRSFFFLSWKCCGCPLFQYVLTFNRVLNKVRTINQNLNTLSLPSYHRCHLLIAAIVPDLLEFFLDFSFKRRRKKKWLLQIEDTSYECPPSTGIR